MTAMDQLKALLQEAVDQDKKNTESVIAPPPTLKESPNKKESQIEITARLMGKQSDTSESIDENIETTRWNDPLGNKEFVTQKQMNDHYGLMLQRIQTQMSTIGGGGEVKFSRLDDIDTSGITDGGFLTYNPSNKKFIFDSLPVASQTELGMIRGSSGVNISSEGLLTIDSTGLTFNFGDFISDVQSINFPDGSTSDVAVLRSQKSDEHIVIQTNGTGAIDVIGGINVFADATVQDALSDEPIFRVKPNGQLRVFVPTSSEVAGAIEIIGNTDNDHIPANQSGVLIHTTGSSGFLNRTYYDGIESYPVLVGRRYNGTSSNPTPVLDGDVIFRIAGQAMTDDGFQTYGPCRISWIATEDQSVGNQGGKLTIDVTAKGNDAFTNQIAIAEFTEDGLIAPLGVIGDLSGNADTVTDGVYKVGNQSIAGDKSFIGNTSLGDVGNISIDGGSAGFILQTDGNGSLSWVLKETITAFERNESTEQQFEVGDFAEIQGLSQPVNPGSYRIESSLEYEVIPANVADQCEVDLNILITEIIALPFQESHVAGFGNGEIITSGTYFIGGAATHTGNIVFDAEGDSDAMFVVICGAALALAASATSTLVNGAKASNIFWRVSGALTIGATCDIKGTYIGSGAIAPGDVFDLEGRLLTTAGAISMSNATYTVPIGTPSLSINIIKTFTMFTPSGAISNTIINGNVGDICSGLGAISGFDQIRGTVYKENDVNAEAIFEVYRNGTPVENSRRTDSSKKYNRSKHLTLLSSTVVTETISISVKISVAIGVVILKNRGIYIFK